MINNLTQQIVQNFHLSFSQKSRNLIFQIFGHEALFETSDLRKNGHCFVLNEDIYRLGNLKLEHLAIRKLVNPAKWMEFLLVYPFEIFCWASQRLASHINNSFINSEPSIKRDLITLFVFVLNCVGITLNILTHSLLAIPKRILAPARYIIRPSIELLKTQPILFGITIGLTLLAIGIITASIFTAGLPILLSAIVIPVSSFCAWPFFQGVVSTCLKMHGALRDARLAANLHQQAAENFPLSSTTEKIAASFHALNPTLTLINKREEQGVGQTVALTTGTEVFFYKPYSTPEHPTILVSLHQKKI